MGLDIYLEHYLDDPETVWKQEKEFEEFYNSLNNEEARTTSLVREFAKRRDLSESGYSRHKEQIEQPSEKYPDHLFKVGYFRSSYNSSGFNSIVGNAIGEDLYTIFPNDQYQFIPQWNESLQKAFNVKTALKKYIKDTPYYVMGVPVKLGSHIVNSSGDALHTFINNINKFDFFNSWSNSQGVFMPKNPLNVVGVIPGKNTLGSPEVYIIYDNKDFSFYIEALDIVIETIEFVLDKPDSERWGLHWSS